MTTRINADMEAGGRRESGIRRNIYDTWGSDVALVIFFSSFPLSIICSSIHTPWVQKLPFEVLKRPRNWWIMIHKTSFTVIILSPSLHDDIPSLVCEESFG